MGRKHCGKRRNCSFLLFPQCFQKACFPGASQGVIVWEWVKPYLIRRLEKTFDLDKVLSYTWCRVTI